MAKISEIEVSALQFAEGAAPATPAAGIVRLYSKTDGLLYSKDDAGAETLVSGGAGGAGSGYSEGTSFPGTPTTGDKFYRTDRDILYAYDGTRWICTCPHSIRIGPTDMVTPIATSGPRFRAPVPWRGTYSIFLGTLRLVTLAAGTNTGSHYWTMALYRHASDDAKTQLGSTVNTSADSTVTWVDKTIAGGGVLDAGAFILGVQALKVGSPDPLYLFGELDYRLVG